jgi:hypothetical protein
MSGTGLKTGCRLDAALSVEVVSVFTSRQPTEHLRPPRHIGGFFAYRSNEAGENLAIDRLLEARQRAAQEYAHLAHMLGATRFRAGGQLIERS